MKAGALASDKQMRKPTIVAYGLMNAGKSFLMNMLTQHVHQEFFKTNDVRETVVNARYEGSECVFLGAQKQDLQEIDYLIRHGESHQERTLTTFESRELAHHARLAKHGRKVEANKKYGFNLNSGVMKICTVHSFKGYESPTVFLLVGRNDSVEMVYTGLTRARENIVVFVHEQSPYLDFFTMHLQRGTAAAANHEFMSLS
jgi:superfamily I DNA/RNA helicase